MVACSTEYLSLNSRVDLAQRGWVTNAANALDCRPFWDPGIITMARLCELFINGRVCYARALNQLTSYEYIGETPPTRMQFSHLRSDWKNTLWNLDQTHVCRHINEAPVAERDSTAIHLFSPEHANSGVNFSAESLKAAGTEDTLVWGAGGGG